MKQTSQNGFGAHVVLVLLVVAAAIGGSGWFVWQHSHKASKTTTAKPAASSTKPATKSDVSLTASDKVGWNTYRNTKLGITMQVPQQTYASNGSPCEKINYKNDTYGNKVPADPNYIAAAGVVPVTVITDGETAYIALLTPIS